MSPSVILTRRHFLQLAVIGTGSLLALNQCTSNISNRSFFTEDESCLMAALAEQIIPTDEWPGGKDAGVVNYISKQLSGPYSRFQSLYRTGLTQIQAKCELVFHKKFENLDWNAQTNFLECMENCEPIGLELMEKSHQDFFNLLRDHCMQGYYGSSRHGGNKNNISYKMLKLDYPVIVGQNRYT